MRLASFAPPILLLCFALTSAAQQTTDQTYSRLNTFSGFFEYSNDSSHIILGNALNRKIGAIGFQYQRRLVHRRLLDFSFIAEARPGMLESDPIQIVTNVETSPTPGVFTEAPVVLLKCTAVTFPPYTLPGTTTTGYFVSSCSRRTVIEQGFSPAGLRVNLMPRHRLQPTFSTFGGYMFAA